VASPNQLSKPRKNEKRIDESALKEVVGSDGFYTMQKVSEGSDIFYFRAIGDYIKGFLISRQTIVLTHRRQVIYKMKVQEMRQDNEDVPVKNDQVVEFPGLKHLRRIIDKNELIGSLLRIVYIGREKTGLGHSAKVFDVFKDLGVISRKEVFQDGSKRKYKKRAGTKPKSRSRRRAGRNAARVPAKV